MEISLFFSLEIDNYQFQFLSKNELGIYAAKTRKEKIEKVRYLTPCYSFKGLMGTIVNRTLEIEGNLKLN